MGTCHACDFSDIWVGDLVQKHVDTCPVETLKFSIYRDDGFDLLIYGNRDIQEYKDHLNQLHPNIKFDVRYGKEGEHLDLWLMLKENIEWKVFMKCPPVYVGPTSCHDPSVRKGIFKGVGHRLRLNSSSSEYFDEAVEVCSKSFAIAGYNYQHSRSELRKFRNQDPVEMIKAGPKEKDGKRAGPKVFYVDNYDPRMPHPRQLISKNYHHIENHAILKKLFPRESLVASCRRLPNLGEILSPTVQPPKPSGGGGSRGGGGGGGGAQGGGDSGSYYCDKFRQGKSCDACLHLQRETTCVKSMYNQRTFAIHGHLTHLPASQKTKLRWFVYLLEDLSCMLQYVGSTIDVCSRWSSTKSALNKANSNSTGLYKHFMDGCRNDTGLSKSHIRLTLIDFLDTTEEKLAAAAHQPGPQCKCTECKKLLKTENKWILRLGTFYGLTGLNTRDEVKSDVRGNYK